MSRRGSLQAPARSFTQFVNNASSGSCFFAEDVCCQSVALNLVQGVGAPSQPVLQGGGRTDLGSLFEDPSSNGGALGQGFVVEVWHGGGNLGS